MLDKCKHNWSEPYDQHSAPIHCLKCGKLQFGDGNIADLHPGGSKQTESIWMRDHPDAATKYPYYAETMGRLEAVLDLAQQQGGVTGPEFASMLASLHARAVARLRPNEQQREHVIVVFREALITLINDQHDLDQRR